MSLDLKHKYFHLNIEQKNHPESYSYEIKKIDEYLGYISWTEIYLTNNDQSKKDDAKDTLWELINRDSDRPEAYFQLWRIYMNENKIDKCMDLCERAFLNIGEENNDEYL